MIKTFFQHCYKGSVLVLFVMLFSVVPTSLSVFAADAPGYVPLVSIPALNNQDGSVNISGYIPGAVRLAIKIAGALAVIMIVIGGVQYASTDAINGKSEGKERIQNAIYGLLLAIGAFFILNSVNPETLNLNLEIKRPGGSGSAVTPAPETPTTPTTPADGCNNCVTLGVGNYSGIPLKTGAGNRLNTVVANNIKNLNAELLSAQIGWRITEAFPPTFTHESACHNDGTCLDANLVPPVVNSARPTADEIRRLTLFYQAASRNGFSLVQYEVATTAEKNGLQAAGLNSSYKIYVNPAFSAPHFHIK